MSYGGWPWDTDEDDDDFEIVYTGDDFEIVPKKGEKKVDKKPSSCQHEWKAESFFTAKVYETCKKCGLKKEDL